MIIKKNSLHYSLVKLFYPRELRYPEYLDSCVYIRLVFKSILVALIVVFVGSVLINFMVVVPLSYAIACIVYGFFFDLKSVLFVSATSICLLVIWFGNLVDSGKLQLTPGFISQALDRTKNKFCSKLEIVD